MNEIRRRNLPQRNRYQFRLSTLLLAVGLLCVILAAANRLAVAHRMTVGGIFVYFLAGFAFWSFLSSLLGLVWAFHHSGTLTRIVRCIVWPGIIVGIVDCFFLVGNAPAQIFLCTLGVLSGFVLGYALFSVFGRSSGATKAEQPEGTTSAEVSQTIEPSRRRFRIATMAILVLVSGVIWPTLSSVEIPMSMRPKIRLVVVLDAPLKVPVGMPVYRSTIAIGSVEGIAPSPTGAGYLMQIEVLDYAPPRRSDVCLISLDSENVPQCIEITFARDGSFDLEELRDGDVIRGLVQ